MPVAANASEGKSMQWTKLMNLLMQLRKVQAGADSALLTQHCCSGSPPPGCICVRAGVQPPLPLQL
jgi:hypothetical protein